MEDETTAMAAGAEAIGRVAADAGAIGRVTARYRGCGRFARHYVAGKLRHDPLTPVLLEGPALGTVLDLGCGRGQFAGLLLEAGRADAVTGLDVNRRLLDQARRALHGLPFRAIEQDLARDASLPPADTVLLADTLYQLTPDAQARLLRSSGAVARRRVLIRTADPDAGWRARFTSAVEHAGRRFWPHAGRTVAPRPIAWIAAALTDAGFTVRQSPSHVGTPFGNALLTAVRHHAPAKRDISS